MNVTMISDMQERLEAVSKVSPTLQDGLHVYGILKEIDEKIHELRHRVFATKQTRRENDLAIGFLEKIKKQTLSFKDLSDRHSIVKKWIEAGYDPIFIAQDPEGVTFFGTADFRAMRLCAKNAKSQLLDADMNLHFDRDRGKILFKVQGEWKSFSEVKDQITYDSENKKFRGWSYTHPEGLVPTDIVEWTRLRPFSTLSLSAHEALKNVARAFWTHSQPEIDPGVAKPCILQVFVRNSRASHSSLFKNAERMLSPRHCFARLVDSEGKLYSCNGYWAPKKEREHFLPGGSLPFTLKTINAHLQIIDSEEFDKFRADSVSIPLSHKRFIQIKERAETMNKNGGFRFSILKGNCCLHVKEILEMAGVKIDPQIPLSEVLSASLPTAADIPYIGRPLSSLFLVVSSVCHSSLSLVPAPVKALSSWFGKVTWFFPRKTLTALGSLFVIALGGARGTPMPASQKNIPIAADLKRKRLIEKPSDIFKSIVIAHSEKVRAWIQQQGSYRLLDQEDQQLCVVNI